MHQLTKDYKSNLDNYEGCKKMIESLITSLLHAQKINFHKVEARTKDVKSLDKKIDEKGKKYAALSDITDLVGIRIITYFEDDIDKVANLIKKEFQIDPSNSVDKRQTELDRFGYKSLHYVATISESRKELLEYSTFKEIKVEIQIRSILQHAWAEIEHDLGYKHETVIPDAFKRDFYRVAALLETADLEFIKIRDGLKNYEKDIHSLIAKNPEKVDINEISLKSFLLNNSISHEIDRELVRAVNIPYDEEQFNLTKILVARLKFFKVKSIKSLEDLLVENKKYVIKFAEYWFALPDPLENSEYGPSSNGIGIFYLSYVLAGEKNDLQIAKDFETQFIDDPFASDTAEIILDTYQKVTSASRSTC